jgi:shikimate kinase
MNKFFLVGIPGCGKSTLGKHVAERLKMPFYDTDDMAVNKIGKPSVNDLFRYHYHERLREEQINAVIEISNLNDPAIVATGAEIALIYECVKTMKNVGYIINIKREVQSIIDDLKESTGSRLVLVDENNGTKINMQEKAVILYSEHLSEYKTAADLNMNNNGSEDEGVERLEFLIQAIIDIKEQGNKV